MIKIGASYYWNALEPVDIKTCNFYKDKSYVKVDSVAQYLTRVTKNNRVPGSIVTVLTPKDGVTIPSQGYLISTFPAQLDNFIIKYYSFVGGVDNIHFVELKFSSEVDFSITGAGTLDDPIMLVNDVETPGADKFYGTDPSGEKGWQPVPQHHPALTIDIASQDILSVDGNQVLSIVLTDYVTNTDFLAHKHYQLYQPNGTNPFVYTDNTGKLTIDGSVQSTSLVGTGNRIVYSTNSGLVESLANGSDGTFLALVSGTQSWTNSIPTIKLSTGATAEYYWKCTNADGSGGWFPIAASQVYKGTIDGSTGIPTGELTALMDGNGSLTGWYYRAVIAGTYDYGNPSGNSITLAVGDDIYYNGSIWQKIPGQGYTLQPATTTILGGVKIGAGITVQVDGTISHNVGTWVAKADLTGATVISNLEIDSYGHPTNWTTRALTASNIGAEPTVTRRNVTAASTKIKLAGTPAASTFESFSIDVDETVIPINNLLGALSIAKGGTGLTSLGTALQLLRVNSTATALEYFTPGYLTGNQSITWTAAGDIAGTASGATSIIPTVTVNAIKNKNIPTLSTGYLYYDSANWVFKNESYLTDAPNNGITYGRLNGAWSAIVETLDSVTTRGNITENFIGIGTGVAPSAPLHIAKSNVGWGAIINNPNLSGSGLQISSKLKALEILDEANFLNPAFQIYSDGTIKWQQSKSGVAANVLYYDTVSKEITYGTSPSGTGWEPALGNPASNGYILSSTTSGTRTWIPPYTHPTQSGIDTGILTGANIISRVIVDTLGHTTTVSTRALTLADLGYTGATNANNYVHPTGFTNQPSTALTGANVLSQITVNTEGHVTGTTSRALTLANLGYTGATNADNYSSWNFQSQNSGGTQIGIQSITSAATATIKAGSNVTLSQTGGVITVNSSYTDTIYSAGTGLSLAGTTFNHSNAITAGTANEGGSNRTLAFGGIFNIPSITYDAQGHITGKASTTLTLPANPVVGYTLDGSGSTNNVNIELLANGVTSDFINLVGTGNTTVAWDEGTQKITINSTAPATAATNLTNTPGVSSVLINSSTGTGTTIAAATTLIAGVMTAADRTTLNELPNTYQAKDADLTAIAAISDASVGFLRKTGANTWGIDGSTYISGINSSMVITALGYTPYNSSNPAGYITISSLNGYATQSWVSSNFDWYGYWNIGANSSYANVTPTNAVNFVGGGSTWVDRSSSGGTHTMTISSSDTNYYPNSMSFNTSNGYLSLSGPGISLSALFDGRYSLLGHTHSYDNYGSWNLSVNGGSTIAITSGTTANFVAGSNITLSRSSGSITISAAGGGVTNHAALSNLDYANSNHTGFAFINGSSIQDFSANALIMGPGSWDTSWMIKKEGDNGLWFKWQNGFTVGIDPSGNVTAQEFYRGSSRKLKKDITPFTDSALNILNNTLICNYTLKKSNEKAIGFIAEDTDPILSGENQESHSFGNHLALLTKAIQEQQEQIKELLEEIKLLKLNIK